MKTIISVLLSSVILVSCVPKKQLLEAQAQKKEVEKQLTDTKNLLNECLTEKASVKATADAYKEYNIALKDQNNDLISVSKNMTVLTSKGAENLEKSLESLREKDIKINRMQDALNKKDSVTLAVVTSLKQVVGMDDEDIQINVEKGVVFISISDRMLFKSASFEVNPDAKRVLAKVAKVINNKPDFECMVEGHTDTDELKKDPCLADNWDLSVKRSTSIIRILTKELGVKPEQLIASGRSFYIPLAANDTPENKAKNRRTRIVVMPKIDQFYDMVEKEMKKQTP